MNFYVYRPSENEVAVLFQPNEGITGTYAIRPEDMPAKPHVAAMALNQAYNLGYQQAQRNIRRALGIDK